MKIIKRKVKMDNRQLYKQIPNDHGLNIKLFGASKLVGFFVITKELKYRCEGYMGTITHEEYKAGVLRSVTPNQIKEVVTDV